MHEIVILHTVVQVMNISPLLGPWGPRQLGLPPVRPQSICFLSSQVPQALIMVTLASREVSPHGVETTGSEEVRQLKPRTVNVNTHWSAACSCIYRCSNVYYHCTELYCINGSLLLMVLGFLLVLYWCLLLWSWQGCMFSQFWGPPALFYVWKARIYAYNYKCSVSFQTPKLTFISFTVITAVPSAGCM